MVSLKLLDIASALLAAAAAQTANTTLRYVPFGDFITEIVCWRALLWRKLQQAGYKNVDFIGSLQTQAPSGCQNANYDRDHEGHSGYLAIDIANKKKLVEWLKKNPADLITINLGRDITRIIFLRRSPRWCSI